MFTIMRRLRDDGCAPGFISHRTDEVLAISNRISVLRDGVLVESLERPEFERARLLSAMIGRTMRLIASRLVSTATDRPVLIVTGLERSPRFRAIDFTLYRGEVLGLAGLVGAGRNEIAETICGLRRRDAGNVRLDGASIFGPTRSSAAALSARRRIARATARYRRAHPRPSLGTRATVSPSRSNQ